MRTKLRWTIAGLTILLIAISLAILTPVMAPVKKGTPVEFWYYTTRVQLGDGRFMGTGGVYEPRSGVFIYFEQLYTGQRLYKVPASEVLPYFPEVLRRLSEASAVDDLPPRVLNGYKTWMDAGQQGGVAGLTRAIRAAKFRELDRQPSEWWPHDVPSEERVFEERWRHTRRYWINVLFEFLYLSGFVLFCVFLFRRRASPKTTALRWALLPVVLYLPYLFGYCRLAPDHWPWSGVLYPWIIRGAARIPWWGWFGTAIDFAILGHVPQILAPISQPPGPMISLLADILSPTSVVMTGVVLGAVAGAISAVKARIGTHHARRTEKEPPTTV
ncbi:MAG: hypothetical protein ABIF82_14225 [Planctomycetota bacterium]